MVKAAKLEAHPPTRNYVAGKSYINKCDAWYSARSWNAFATGVRHESDCLCARSSIVLYLQQTCAAWDRQNRWARTDCSWRMLCIQDELDRSFDQAPGL